jgi:hypothetical protein
MTIPAVTVWRLSIVFYQNGAYISHRDILSTKKESSELYPKVYNKIQLMKWINFYNSYNYNLTA